MDLSTINDLVLLKSMAYDQIGIKEQAERSLSAINNRITEVFTAANQSPVSKPVKSDEKPEEQPQVQA